MKHLFYIYSGITLEICLSIIKVENLKHEDCILFIDRFHPTHIPNDLKVLFLGRYFNCYLDFKVSLFFVKPMINTLKFNRLIKKNVSYTNFKAYVPQHSLNIINILTNNKYCVSFSYLEEGTFSYIKHENHFTSHSLKKENSFLRECLFKLCFLSMVPREKVMLQMNASKLDKYYAISEYCFPDVVQKKIILPIPFEKVNYKGKISVLLVIESYVECDILSLDEYTCCVEKFISVFDDELIGLFHYKFHPRQSIEVKEMVKCVIQSNNKISAKEIDQNSLLENILFTFNPKIFHVNSSIAIYGAVLGCEIISLLQFVKKSFPHFKTKTSQIPKVFSDKTVYIK